MRAFVLLGVMLCGFGCTGAAPTAGGPGSGQGASAGTTSSAGSGPSGSATAAPAPTETQTGTAAAPDDAAPPTSTGAAGTVVGRDTVCPGATPIAGPGAPRDGQSGGRGSVVIIDSSAAAQKELGCSGAGVDFTKQRVAMFRLQGINESYSMKGVRREKDGIVIEPAIARLCRGAAMMSTETFLVLLDAGSEPVRLSPTYVPMPQPCLAP